MAKAGAGRPVAISARETNTTTDVNDAWRRGLLVPRTAASGSSARDSNVILVKNNSGADRARFDVLGQGAPLFLPADNLSEFLESVAVSGETPTLAHVGNFAVLLEPLPAGEIGPAAVGGEWNTTIVVDHEQQDRADVAVGAAQLTSNWYGGAEILWKEAGTGARRARVRLGSFFAGPIDGVAAESIAAGGSGDVTIRHAGATTIPASTRTGHLIFLDGGLPLTVGTQVSMYYKRDEQKLKMYHAGCP